MRQKGFTLIELLVVISIIGLLASVVLVSLRGAQIKARDTKRLADMSQIQKALALYYDKNGTYPAPASDSGCGGWDTSGDGNFLPALRTSGFMGKVPNDPSKVGNCTGYYYYRYSATGSCLKPFYVLGVLDMETSGRPYPDSPGWQCTTRNWQTELDWVTGSAE